MSPAVWSCPEDTVSLWACLLVWLLTLFLQFIPEYREPSDADVLFVVDIYSVHFDQS